MKFIIIYIVIAMAIFCTQYAHGQEAGNQKSDIETLEKAKESVIAEEKKALKKAIIAIDERLAKKEITSQEAQKLKATAAKKHALNIENKNAIITNKIALLERNGKEEISFTGAAIELGLGQESSNGDRLFGIKYNKGRRPLRYDKRTTSDFVFAVGFNNLIQEGTSFNDSDYRFGGSYFVELGWAWKTRILQESNFWRIKYGLSFQINALRPTGNRIFVDENEQTTLQDFEFNLDKSRLKVTNLVVPVHFEFGPSKKWEGEDYVRYSTRKKFKIGLGGYGGFNIGTRQKIKYDTNGGGSIKERTRDDFNVNNLVYGVSAYAGWRWIGIYAKYDLSPLFNDDQPEQRNISLGFRFDLN